MKLLILPHLRLMKAVPPLPFPGQKKKCACTLRLFFNTIEKIPHRSRKSGEEMRIDGQEEA